MNAEVQRRKFRMDSGHKDTEVKYTESPKYQCLEFLRKNSVELYLAYCGREICEAEHTYGPAVRQEYLLHYVISGKGTFMADGKTTELGAHDAFLIMPEETTVYRADAKEPWSYVWAAFDGIRAYECLEHAGFSAEQRVGHFEQEEALTACVDAMLAAHQLTYANDLVRQSQLALFLAGMIREYQTSHNTRQQFNDYHRQEYADYAAAYIEQNYHKDISVNDMCSYIGITRSYLTKIFKQVHHVSPYDYLLGVRMNKASLLLQTTALPIKQIAEMVGYKDALVFSKAFKQKIGTSPRAFRDSSATLVLSHTKNA